jgi:chemotaxis protein methyltransferase CheR
MFAVTADETRRIVQIIVQRYGIDLSTLTMASMRLKISRFCRDHPLQTPADIRSRLQDKPGFINLFLAGILTNSPYLFRDPELWILLKNQILPELSRFPSQAGILIPDSVSGEEIDSMAILLHETGLKQQIRLTATCVHDSIRDGIVNGFLTQVHYKNGMDNYLVYNPGSTLETYYKNHRGRYYRKPGLMEPVQMLVQPDPDQAIDGMTKLVLYRNRMIYHTLERNRWIINRMLDRAADGTIFIIGIKESFGNLGLLDRLQVISRDLNIYAKKG